MKRRFLLLTAFALVLAIPVTSAADGKGPWIHVEVLEEGGDGAKVKVNVPLSLARLALEMAPEEVMSEGYVHLEDTELSIQDLRRMWTELREAGDAEFVTVEEGDETVKVFRKGDRLFIHVDENGAASSRSRRHEDSSGARVRVEIPVVLVDALLGGSRDELDIDAAIEALGDMTGEIVRVEDGRDLVRIWID